MIDRPNDTMKGRLLVGMTLLFMAVVIYTIVMVFKISVKESHKWQTFANSQQLTSTTVSASRGTIYDSNGQVLAQSATVYTVYVDSAMLWEYIDKKDKLLEDRIAALAEEDNENRRVELTKKIENTYNSAQTHEKLVTYLAKVLKLSEDEIEEDISDKSSRYLIIKKEVEKTDADKIEKYLSKLEIDGIRCDPTTKRFYPQNTLAANIIGHMNYDEDQGLYGIESYYDENLSGVDGRIITAADKYGTEIPYKYKQSYEAQDGDSLYLNIDVNIQYYLEKALADCVNENKPAERACAIIMNPNTGAIYAMATNYSYDPNNPSEITDETTARQLAALSDESQIYSETQLGAWNTQWRNKAISELYYPGSVFKVITGSAALEEKAISLDDYFSCGTSIHVEDRDFDCWSTNDHGMQNLASAMTNSCNPAFIQIGQRLGAENLFKYLKSYGFIEKTGIDLPAESNSLYMPLENMGNVELASESFGQTNKITPIQMITAYSAVINGGYLVTPQVVDKITDCKGNIVKDFQPVIKRQVISEDVSASMREILEGVVSSSPSSNSYIKGYRIGGKSGTSQKLDVDITGKTYVSSYCAFAPADNPEIIMLIMVDDPQGEKYYGSQVAAPVCSQVLSEVLPYLGFFPEYTDEELAELEVSVPNVEYNTVADAEKTIKALGLETTVVGDGDTVLRQCPTGVSIQKGGNVVLYTDTTTPELTVSVPNVQGLSKEYAKELLQSVGLNMTVDGSSVSDENVFAAANESTGMTVALGTSITVSFQQYTATSQ